MRLSRIAVSAGLGFTLVVGGGAPASGQARAIDDSLTVSRLASLGHLWGVVKYFYPDIAAGSPSWDSALVAAIPRARAARSSEEWGQGVDQMLRTLHDPLTARIGSSVRPAPSSDTAMTWLVDSTLIVQIGDVSAGAATQTLNLAKDRIASASRVVFDLRTGRTSPRARIGRVSEAFATAEINELLLDKPTPWPVRRFRMYSGLPEQDGTTPYTYWPGMQTAAVSIPFQPASTAPKRIVWLVDRGTDIPIVALAMRTAGSAQIIVEGPSIDLQGFGEQYRMDLADGVSVDIRTSDLVSANGSRITATRAIDSRAPRDSAALAAAVSVARGSAISVSEQSPSAIFAPTPDAAYAEMNYPSLEYRLLGAFRFWNAIQYFFPYKSLTGEDWNDVLRVAIPKFEAARDSLEYAMAVAEMTSKIHDSHGRVMSKALDAYFGDARPSIRVRFLGKDLVVTAISTDSAVRVSGVRLGDVINRVDGQPISERRARLAPYLAYSTPAALDSKMAGIILGGTANSVAHLEVTDATRRPRQVSLGRRRDWRQVLRWTRSGRAWQMLANNIGYVDLERLTVPQVDSMFDALAGTKAIIFDDRSYPQFTVWSIASRLASRADVIEGRFSRPVVTTPDTLEHQTDEWAQDFRASDKPRYRGKTVLLVDERTVSMAEHTGLLFKAANSTTIVGSQTMGANGDVTNVVLPGGILVNFTGQSVRWPDGRQLQRIGLQPDIVVRPTVAGIRAGEDEVLDRAILFISAGK